jgi:phosphomannomutase
VHNLILTYHRIANAETNIKFVNTSLHGVGNPFVQKAFEIFGFSPFIPVKDQQAPDPEFPTVRFPNPEEKGTLFTQYVRDDSTHGRP